jgi:hypothetical protein
LLHLNKKLLALILVLVVVIAAVSIETYAFSYITINNLEVVSTQNAKLPQGYWFNESYTFSSDGSKWLILFQAPTNVAWNSWIYIFKTSQHTSSFIKNMNLIPQRIEFSATPTSLHAINTNIGFIDMGSVPMNMYNSLLFNNYGYTAPSGTSYVNFAFAFTFRIYETTLLGIFPLNEATIHFNCTIPVS